MSLQIVLWRGRLQYEGEMDRIRLTGILYDRLDELIGMLESGFTERARNAEEIREEIQKVGEAMEG